MAAKDQFGSWVRKVLPHWAKPLWANTFRGREEAGRRRSRIERGERKEERSREGELRRIRKKDKT